MRSPSLSSSSSSLSTSTSSSSSSSSSDEEEDELPSGWFEAHDERGRRYYYHGATREVTWIRPVIPAAITTRSKSFASARSFWQNLERQTQNSRKQIRKSRVLRRTSSMPCRSEGRDDVVAAAPSSSKSPLLGTAVPILRRVRSAPKSSDTVALASERSRQRQRQRSAARNRTADAPAVRRLVRFTRDEQGGALGSPSPSPSPARTPPRRLVRSISSSSSSSLSPAGSRLFHAAMATPRFPNGIRDLTLEGSLGSGTFSTVRVATDAQSGTRVAVKCISLAKIRSLGQETNALRELRVLKAMSGFGALGASGERHPLIVAVLGALRDQQSLYVVLELCEGGDLERRLDSVERFVESDAQFYAGCIALGLEALHARGFCYRDLKPENILLAHDGTVRLSDFGLATERDRRTSTVCGSRHYMAPEIRTQRSYDPVRSDWWAFGITVAELLSGWTPFDPDIVVGHGEKTGGDPFALERKICDESIGVALDRVQSTIATHDDPAFDFSPGARLLMARLLDKDPATRMSTGRDVRAASWFTAMSFERLLSRQETPPWVPPVHDIEAETAASPREDVHAFSKKVVEGALVEEDLVDDAFARSWEWEASTFVRVGRARK